MSPFAAAIQSATSPLGTASSTLFNPAGAGTTASVASPVNAGGATPGSFADLVTDAVGEVNQLDQQARATVEGVMTGSGVDVHQAVIATEKASTAFELALAVRNKAVEAYQAVMGMQF